MNLLQIIFIGVGSVVVPIIVVTGLLTLAVMLAVTLDELFELFISKDRYK
jgi:thiosulfate reductase cytochrome b subunit